MCQSVRPCISQCACVCQSVCVSMGACVRAPDIISIILTRKIMTNHDVSLNTKIGIVIVLVFSVVLYGAENWTLKLSTVTRTCRTLAELKEMPLDRTSCCGKDHA